MQDFVIIIPTFNRPTLLPGAVRSALEAAGRAGGAVLVVDDGEVPPAADTLAGFGQPNLRILRNSGVHGPGAARNFGVSQSGEEVIFFLDDDDTIDPTYCERIMRSAIAAGADFGFSAVRQGTRIRGQKLDAGLVAQDTPLARRLVGLGMGFWIRRGAFLATGGIDETIPVNEDTEFCLKLAAAGLTGWYDPDIGVTLRAGPATASDAASVTGAADAVTRARAFELMLSRHGETLARDPALRRRFILRLVKYAQRGGDSAAVRRAVGHEPQALHRLLLRAGAAIHGGVLAARRAIGKG